jgi:cell division protein FtsL
VPSVALPAPRRGGSTGVFERIRALPEHRVVDRLLRSRVWIWVIGIMLGGIVAMQVSLLKMNSGISRSVEQSATLERVNSDLETEVARLASGERIQATATKEGMVAPPAGDVGYLAARPIAADAQLAADRMQPPSQAARDVMANGGRSLTAPAIAPLPATAPPSTAIAPTATATPAPSAAATAATPAPVATPVATATPAPAATATPAPAAAQGTGATTAPGP